MCALLKALEAKPVLCSNLQYLNISANKLELDGSMALAAGFNYFFAHTQFLDMLKISEN